MTRLEQNDEELVKSYLKGEEESFRILIGRYLRPIYNFTYRYTASGPDAEDIAQEVFVKVWKNLKRYDGRTNFRAWLFTIARNTAIDWLRKKRVQPVSPLDAEMLANTLADRAPLPSELSETKLAANAVNNAVEKLNPDIRAILQCRYDGYTFREIAKIMRKPLDTVKSQHRRAIAKLKILLDKSK